MQISRLDLNPRLRATVPRNDSDRAGPTAPSLALWGYDSTMDEREDDGRVRLDKWLWAARFYKTRGLASEAIAGGKVQVNGDRAKRARAVQPGDEIRIRLGPYEHHVVVRALSARRGPASAAAELYEETPASRAPRCPPRARAPPAPASPAPARRRASPPSSLPRAAGRLLPTRPTGSPRWPRDRPRPASAAGCRSGPAPPAGWPAMDGRGGARRARSRARNRRRAKRGRRTRPAPSRSPRRRPGART